MSRLQLSLNVTDLDTAVTFYTRLLGAPPAKLRPGTGSSPACGDGRCRWAGLTPVRLPPKPQPERLRRKQAGIPDRSANS